MEMASNTGRRRVAADYEIACICPMDVELAPVEAMLDEIHDPLPTTRDQNAYTLGHIGRHNVVVAIMPQIGNNVAAMVATQLLNDFPSIRFGLLVGIGGGVPGNTDVRLGDIVVSEATDTFGGVVQYDLGKRLGDSTFKRIGQLNKPPAVLRANIRKLKSQHRRQGHHLPQLVSEMLEKNPYMQLEYGRPVGDDRLFEKTYPHTVGGSCEGCDMERVIKRPARPSQQPEIHYGTIGSANMVVKDAKLRDNLRDDMSLLCVEMEAAGLMDDFPCLVIRGICDYADSHKNKEWQPYAAATAAAYMKTLLLIIPTQDMAMLSRAAESTTSSFKLGLHLYDAPYLDPGLFVGRSAELREMERILHSQRVPQEHRRLVLGGMGGMGKTQLAITYAKRHSRSYDSVFWLNAASEIALKKSFRYLAQLILDLDRYQELGDEEQVRLHVTRWLLGAKNTQWLMIFDNYDDPDAYNLGMYCPYGAHGSAIITTRLPERVQGQQMLLRPVSDIDEGLQLLMIRSMRVDASRDIYARKLVERVQGLPLALATAGAYLKQSSWTFEEYLGSYEKYFYGRVHQSHHLPEYRDRTLYTTWDITYNRLRSDYPQAAKLLRSFAFFDNQHLRYDLFRASNYHSMDRKFAKMKSKFRTLLRAREEINFLKDLSRMSNDEFESAMHVLIEFLFVEIKAEHEDYSVHSCVHDWALASLNADAQIGGYWFAFDQVADFIAGIRTDHYDYAQYNVMAPHAARLSNVAFSSITENVSLERLKHLHNIANFLRDQRQLEEAKRMYDRALAGMKKALGEEHELTLKTIHSLGTLYYYQGKLSEAENIYDRALAGKKKVFGEEHESTLLTIHSLGTLYYSQGKLSKAKEIYDRALAGMKKALGEEHELTLKTMHNLGFLYHNQGKLVEAEKMYDQVLAGKRKVLGEEHESTLDTIHELGVLYFRQGKLVEAEKMYDRALAGKEKVLGAEHESTLGTIENLGNLYYDQGKLVEAEKMYDRALAGKEKFLGTEHESTLSTINGLGNLYYDQGKLVEAERMYDRALAGKEKFLGAEHESTLITIQNLGRLYVDQGRVIEAEQMHEQALIGYKKAYRKEDPRRLAYMLSYADLFVSQLKLQKATQMCQCVIEIYANCLPDTMSQSTFMTETYARALSNVVRMSDATSIDTQPYIHSLVKVLQRVDRITVGMIRYLVTALLYLGDDENVKRALTQYVAHSTCQKLDLGGTRCDACLGRLDIDKGMNVCRQCIDTVICDSCLSAKQNQEPLIPNCQHDKFYDFGGTIRQALESPDSTDLIDKDTWLHELGRKYGVDSA